MSMCESILTIALVCTVKYLHYCDYYYTLGNDSQSTPKLIAYGFTQFTPHVLTYIICFSGKNSKVFLHKNIIVYTCIICTKHPFSAGEAVSRSACFMLHLIEDAGPSYDLPAHIADML